MIEMTNAINKANFGGARVVTCNTCHNGQNRPTGVPSLLTQYSVPEDDPNAVEIVPGSKGPSATEILSSYVAALGGAQRVAALTSLVAKGTYSGFETYNQPVAYELYAKAPNQRTVIVHTQNGDSTTTVNGQVGWVAAVDKPLPLMPLTPGEIDGVTLDNSLLLASNISATLSQLRAGFPVTTVGDTDANVIQGTGAGRTLTKLFFDARTGLLLRSVRFINTAIGTVPAQTDYAEWKDVAGVKVPTKITATWTSGQGMIELKDVQANVPIDAARFAQPAPTVLKRLGTKP
jgi:hypothetical protein